MLFMSHSLCRGVLLKTLSSILDFALLGGRSKRGVTALGVLDYDMSVVAGPLAKSTAAVVANYNKFVEVLGLRALFLLFMRNPVAKGARLAAALRGERKYSQAFGGIVCSKPMIYTLDTGC